jgi:hypothetical protein
MSLSKRNDRDRTVQEPRPTAAIVTAGAFEQGIAMAIDPRVLGKLRAERDDGRPTEDDIAKAKLGPRGIPGEPPVVRETPELKKNTPPIIDPGHTQ